MRAEEIADQICEDVIAYNEQCRQHKPDHACERIHNDEPALEYDHNGREHYPSEQPELVLEIPLFEGKHECHESADVPHITDQRVVHIDEMQKRVTECQDWVSPQEDVAEAEVVGQEIEVPIQILGDGDVGLFLFVSFYGVDFPENKEVQD